MRYLPLKIWFLVSSGLALSAVVVRLVWEITYTPSAASLSIIIMVILVFTDIPNRVSHDAFHVLHPLHVILSALTTTAMYRKFGNRKLWTAVLIGYCGSIGIATLSDAIIPYLGGALLGIEIEFHIPFIETEKLHFIGIKPG